METLQFTREDEKRVKEGILETQAYIEKEMEFPVHLRQNEKVAKYKSHLDYLNRVLETKSYDC